MIENGASIYDNVECESDVKHLFRLQLLNSFGELNDVDKNQSYNEIYNHTECHFITNPTDNNQNNTFILNDKIDLTFSNHLYEIYKNNHHTLMYNENITSHNDCKSINTSSICSRIPSIHIFFEDKLPVLNHKFWEEKIDPSTLSNYLDYIDSEIENFIKNNYHSIIEHIKFSQGYINKITKLIEKVHQLKYFYMEKMSEYHKASLNLCKMYRSTVVENDVYKMLVLVFTLKKSMMNIKAFVDNINTATLNDCYNICNIITLCYELLNKSSLIHFTKLKYIVDELHYQKMNFLLCIKNEMYNLITECFDNIIACCYHDPSCWTTFSLNGLKFEENSSSFFEESLYNHMLYCMLLLKPSMFIDVYKNAVTFVIHHLINHFVDNQASTYNKENTITNNNNEACEPLILSNFLFYSKKCVSECIIFTKYLSNISINIIHWKYFYLWFFKTFAIFFKLMNHFSEKTQVFLTKLIDGQIDYSDSNMVMDMTLSFVMNQMDSFYTDTCDVVHNIFNTIVNYHSENITFPSDIESDCIKIAFSSASILINVVKNDVYKYMTTLDLLLHSYLTVWSCNRKKKLQSCLELENWELFTDNINVTQMNINFIIFGGETSILEYFFQKPLFYQSFLHGNFTKDCQSTSNILATPSSSLSHNTNALCLPLNVKCFAIGSFLLLIHFLTECVCFFPFIGILKSNILNYNEKMCPTLNHELCLVTTVNNQNNSNISSSSGNVDIGAYCDVIIEHIVDFLYDIIACYADNSNRLILGADALEFGVIKNITAKTLAILYQCIHSIYILFPWIILFVKNTRSYDNLVITKCVYEHFFPESPHSTQNITLIQFHDDLLNYLLEKNIFQSTVIKDVKEFFISNTTNYITAEKTLIKYKCDIFKKIVEIVTTLFYNRIEEWENWKNIEISKLSKTISIQLLKLNQTLDNLWDSHHIKSLFECIFKAIRENILYWMYETAINENKNIGEIIFFDTLLNDHSLKPCKIDPKLIRFVENQTKFLIEQLSITKSTEIVSIYLDDILKTY